MLIPLTRLVPHPANPNRMKSATFAKLRAHIARTGRYEHIVVRPLPPSPPPFQEYGLGEGEAPTYQILNGHHRVRALAELGHETARCDVWDVDDTEALILVATLNRLAGEDDPHRRDALLAELLVTFEPPRLADLLPESADDLQALAQLAKPDAVPDPAPPKVLEAVTFLTFALTPEQAAAVESALAATGAPDRAAALLALAQAFEKDRNT